MQVLIWVLGGLAVGIAARVVMRTKSYGWLGDLTLGTLGGLVGGWVLRRLGVTAPDQWAGQLFVALLGAMMLVGAFRLVRRLSFYAPLPDRTIAQAVFDFEGQMRKLSDLERRVVSTFLKGGRALVDPNKAFDAQLTFGERVADKVATFGGSWTFIGLFMLGLVGWMALNTELQQPFDPYPFILLNLVLSCVAALQAPVIMMSQNRQSAKDRMDARNDYEVNLRAEMEIVAVHAKLDALRDQEWAALVDLQRQQLELLRRIEARLDGGLGRA